MRITTSFGEKYSPSGRASILTGASCNNSSTSDKPANIPRERVKISAVTSVSSLLTEANTSRVFMKYMSVVAPDLISS